MVLSPDGHTVYVALGQDDAIGVIDVARAAVTGTVPAGRDPQLVGVSPDGHTLFVANEEIAHASAIDVATGQNRVFTPGGVEPQGDGITRGGKKGYVTPGT